MTNVNFSSVELAFKWLRGEGAEYHDPSYKVKVTDWGNLCFLWEEGKFSMLIEFLGREETLLVTINAPGLHKTYYSDLDGCKYVAKGGDLYVLGKRGTDATLKVGWDDRVGLG